MGEDEADIKQNKISIGSPIARALIGKVEGDVAEVQAPGGVREYDIVAVQYIWYGYFNRPSETFIGFRRHFVVILKSATENKDIVNQVKNTEIYH